VKKIKKYHAAAGESGFHLVKNPIGMLTAYVVLLTEAQNASAHLDPIGCGIVRAGVAGEQDLRPGYILKKS
jgi:hypothetical protein